MPADEPNKKNTFSRRNRSKSAGTWDRERSGPPENLPRVRIPQWQRRAYAWLGGKAVLPFNAASPEGWVQLETNGVPIEAVNHSLEKGVFSTEELREIVGVATPIPPSRQSNLSRDRSARFLRLTLVKAKAREVFGSKQKANRWLHTFNRTLQKAPIELLSTEQGARLVEEEINRIDWGVFS